MGQIFRNKKIFLGITGGIAAYKAAEVVRLLQKLGADIQVGMTKSATEFITTLTLQTLSGKPVKGEHFDLKLEAEIDHISCSRNVDIILIAPCSANFLAKLANGLADDWLSTFCLAATQKIFLAPAMNQAMWHNAATKRNVEILKTRGFIILGPDSGTQACGEHGLGRMLEPDNLITEISNYLTSDLQLLNGLQIVITAGATIEAIDPIRFISNHSSGLMGYSIAQAAIDMGAKVTLVSGVTNNLTLPNGVKLIKAISAKEMYAACLNACKNVDIFISVAAVCDFSAKEIAEQKIKKVDNLDELNITLKKNPDILKTVAQQVRPKYSVGFAAETENLINNAKEKLINKNVDMFCANDVSKKEIGFNSQDNELHIFTKTKKFHIKKNNKQKIARELIKIIAEQYYEKYPSKNS